MFGECENNVVWSLKRFQGLFLSRDALPAIIVTDRDLALMNAVKIVFPKATNLLCRFHIDKNVKAKCKTLVVFTTWTFGTLAKRLTNNTIMLQHTKTKTSFETSTHVVGHVFKVTLYKRLIGMVSRYALNQIAAEFERVHYVGKNPSRCGCVMRTTHGLPCACELSKYVVDQGLSEPQVSITEEMKTISKQFEELDVCGKVTLKSKLREIANPNLNSRCAPPENVKTKGMGEDSWLLVRNHLLKELTKWSDEYMNLVGGIDRFEELKRSLLVDGLSMVITDKWMNITDMRYVIVSRYNVILVSLSLRQNMTFFPLRSQPPTDSSVHRVFLRDRCLLPPVALLRSTHCHHQAK
ncbi:hypothetical protein HKD37_17G048031 [Glycine soja]